MLRLNSSPLVTRLDVRWQDAAWPVAVLVLSVPRARANCRSARRPGVRSALRNPYLKRFNP